jgi:hypothetical protein
MSAEPCQRSSGNSRHASFIQRGTIAGSRVCCDHQQNPPTPLRNADPPLERLGQTVRRRSRIETLMRIRTRDASHGVGARDGEAGKGLRCGEHSPSARGMVAVP